MILAAYRSGAYNLLLLLHIVSLVAAFAPAVIHPLLGAQTQRDSAEVSRATAGHMAANTRRVHFPALVLTGVFGFGMVPMSDPVFQFDQTWVYLAVLVWIALCGVVSGVILPGERKAAEGVEAARSQVAVGGQIATFLLIVMLYLMIWKPGI